MDSFFLLIVLVLAFIVVSLIMTWVNRASISHLRAEVDLLRQRLEQLSMGKASKSLQESLPKEEPQSQPKHAEESYGAVIRRHTITEKPRKQEKKSAKPRASFEETFGKWLPVWIGGLALALAGFFLVKYSIETGLLGPGVRILLGLVFGVGLVIGADWLRKNTDIANTGRMAQALSGAGIADLYFCVFAASNFYGLISPTLGFLGMAMVTAFAVVLSLRHGMPIAVLGLMGGFITPALFSSSDPQAPLLFGYLYLVCAGLLLVIRQSQWWVLSIPTVLAAMLWVVLWMFGGHFVSSDSLWLGLFLMAISATVVVLSKDQYGQNTKEAVVDYHFSSILNYLALSGAILLLGVVAGKAGLGPLEWSLFGLLSLGGIGLAYFEQRLYGFVPWIAMGVNAVMLTWWYTTDLSMLALVISLFGFMFMLSGYLIQSRSERPLLWSGLTSAASLGYYLLAYYKLRYSGLVPEGILFWGSLAFTFAAVGTYITQSLIKQIPEDYPYRQHVLAIYSATCTAFVAIGLGIELPREFLSVAIAAQMFAITLINTRIDIKAMRYIAGILVAVFGYLLFPQVLLLIQLTFYTIMGAKVYLVSQVPIVDWPVFQLGLPALFFVGGSVLLRQKQDDRLVRLLEVSAIALLSIMGYYLMRHMFHVDENVLFTEASFIEAGVITNALFLYALACFWVGRTFVRPMVSLSALALCSIAIFRVCYFDIFISNPLFSGAQVGASPLFNGLLVVYGLPLVWTWLAINEVKSLDRKTWQAIAYIFMLVLAFVYLSLNVRHFFHGSLLNAGSVGNGEIYTYSVAWLLFGIGLLIVGTHRENKLIRVASLVIMILTVGKVFLYDARELEGLYRVFSFLGLGVCLMGLSWFYTKFVFTERKR